MKIQIVSGSTREGRGTPKVAKWVEKTANGLASDVEFELVDLADYDVPFMTEQMPPMGNKNRQLSGGAQKWVDKLGEADGFIFVTPEYNHSVPASLKNAIDTLDFQLMKKPVAIVSHGAMGGARANEHLRLIVNSNLGGVPVPNSVTLKAPVAFADIIAEDGTIGEEYADDEKALHAVIEAVMWYTDALKIARDK